MNTNTADRLFEYIMALGQGETNRALFDEYRNDLERCSAPDVNSAIHRYLDTGEDYDRMETVVARFIRACGKGLDSRGEGVPAGHPFFERLLRENRDLERARKESVSVFSSAAGHCRRNPGSRFPEDLRAGLAGVLRSLQAVASHYLTLQNTLFPVLEKHGHHMNCLKLMWHIQDTVQRDLKECSRLLEEEPFDFQAFNRTYGRAFLNAGNLIYREEKILYPLAAATIPKEHFAGLADENGGVPSMSSSPGQENGPGGRIGLSVGELTAAQIDLVLTNLPVDITFVDEHDRVRYFSHGRERIFPRAPGIIGRNVENCHPPKSLHVVRKIIEDFKAGRKKTAEFWIDLEGRLIHIRYFALFEEDEYRGVLEVSQDITGIRALTGEKRLLDES